ncbi:MAG: type II secretion system protein GspJ [Candidatus Omnitrophota bacterium]
MRNFIGKKSGFSLVELIVSVAIAAVLFLGLYSSFSLGINCFKQLKAKTDVQAQKIITQLNSQLRSAFISNNEDNRFNFQGSGSSLEFTTTVAAGVFPEFMESEDYKFTDLLNVSYRIKRDNHKEENHLIYTYKDALGQGESEDRGTNSGEKTKVLSKDIKSISFFYYNGSGWQRSWNSSRELPQAVEIEIQLQDRENKDRADSYFSAVKLQCAYTENNSG